MWVERDKRRKMGCGGRDLKEEQNERTRQQQKQEGRM